MRLPHAWHRLGRRARLISSVIVLLVGVLGAGAVLLAVNSSHKSPAAEPPPVNPGAASRLAAPTTSRPASPTPTPATSSSPSTSSAPADPPITGSGPGPVEINIAAAGIDAPVVPIGVTSTNEVDIPEDVRTVGWYRYSPIPPASAGSTVLVGHVDSAAQGEGAFFTLHNLDAGDRVTITMPSGATLAYRVVSREAFPKTNVPLAELFSTTGPPRLTLITCGGQFDSSERSYLDNIVVTAVPI